MANLNVDFIIFASFLALYLIIGFIYRLKHKRIDDYAKENGKFATSKIVAIAISTWIGAGFMFLFITETIKDGVHFLLPNLGLVIAIILTGVFILPRMSEFIGKSSIAEIMQDLWGTKVAFTTAICYIMVTLGILTFQIQNISAVLQYFGLPKTSALIISGIILLFYCIVASSRTAIFSDIIQFTTFCCLIPVVSFVIWKTVSNGEIVWEILKMRSDFNLKTIFTLYNPKLYSMFTAFEITLVPRLGPFMIQIISISQNSKQAALAFKIQGSIILVLQIFGSLIAFLMISQNLGSKTEDLSSYLLDNYAINGFGWIIAISITSIVMSTAYFSVNTSANMLMQSILKPLGFKKIENPRLVLIFFAILAAPTSIYLAFTFSYILPLIKITYSIYTNLVSIPFLLAILGFRSSMLSVLTGITASIISMMIYQWRFDMGDFNFFIPGMIANITFLFGSHYLLRQPGGWIGIKGKCEFEEFKQEKRKQRQKFMFETFGLSFLDFCKQGLPTSASNISFFGIFALVSIFLTQISLPNIIAFKYIAILDFIYPSAFILATNLVFSPIWLQALKKTEFLSIVWLLSVLYISIIIPTIFAFISNFLPMQMIIALINLIAIFVMFKWNISVFLLITGGLCASLYLYCFAEHANMENLQLQISYLLLFLSGALITFLKPYKDEKKTPELLSDITKQIQDISEQTLNFLIVKKDIINNFKQDIQTPIENIGAGIVTLNQNKNTLEKQNRDSAELIYREYRNLQRNINKLVDLSKFNTRNVLLNHQDINFEELVENAISLCKSSDFENPDLNFKINTQAIHLIITCDRDKIFQCLEYLIRNAIKFTKKGTIEVLLENQDIVINKNMTSTIKCSIIDEGIGIPEDELQHIFGPFTQSSYTKGKNYGKGLGLALCQRIIELHHGIIWAENNKTKPGSTFSFIIPRTQIS